MLIAVTESIVAFLIFQIQLRSSELEQHQISLVTYEEKFRTSIFNHLHDKVQSRLFSVGIQLNQIKSDLDSETAEKVEEIVAQLEEIRILNVRKSSIEIVPPISPVGLFPSILSLLKSHKPVLDGKFLSQLKTPLSDSEEDRFGIGIYRIIEQALINSLIHGKATEIEVKISEDKSDLLLEITNNGKLLDTAQISQGHGFAVIDGWVSKLKGDWTISNRKEQVCLQVRFER
jgi:glucose-6-phosphate-specific signal transduction histidine kinase